MDKGMLMEASERIFGLTVRSAEENAPLTVFPTADRLFQPKQFLKQEAFMQLLGTVRTRCRCVIMDLFMLRWQIIRHNGQIVMAGPYRSSRLVESGSRDIIRMTELTETDLKSFLQYLSECPVMTDEVVLQIVMAAAGMERCDHPDETAYMDLQQDLTTFSQPLKAESQPTTRPDTEFEYMKAVRNGDAEKAKEIQRKIYQRYRGMRQTDKALLHSISTCAVYRTMARTAARMAGVPTVLLDTVTGRYRTASMQMPTAVTGEDLSLAMTDELCRLVRTYRNSRYTGVVRNAMSYIDMYYHAELSVQGIADAFHIQQSRLSAVFLQQTGMAVSDYITKTRLRETCSMLVLSENPIGWIGAACGIPDASYFSKVFRKAYGMSPAEYRKRHGDGEALPVFPAE